MVSSNLRFLATHTYKLNSRCSACQCTEQHQHATSLVGAAGFWYKVRNTRAKSEATKFKCLTKTRPRGVGC